MHIFNKLVDSYRSKNYKEFRELCESSLTMDVEKFAKLQDLLETAPDVNEAYMIALEYNHKYGVDY